jgi:tetratricopeptide (TPR) repeat protein
LKLDPGNPLAYYIRGIINLDLQKHVLAIEDFTRSLDCAAKKSAKDRPALEQFSHETEWLFLFRGRCYARLGDYKKAEKDLKCALQANPDLAPIYCDLGEIYYQLDRYDLAMANFDKSALLDPQNEKVFNLRGLVYNAKGEYAAAVRDFSLAIDLKPGEVLYCNRGVSYTNSGLYEKALSDFNEALRRNPRYHAAWFFKGETFRLQGRPVPAADSYERYLKLTDSEYGSNPSNVSLSDHIAKARKYLETTQKNPKSVIK